MPDQRPFLSLPSLSSKASPLLGLPVLVLTLSSWLLCFPFFFPSLLHLTEVVKPTGSVPALPVASGSPEVALRGWPDGPAWLGGEWQERRDGHLNYDR